MTETPPDRWTAFQGAELIAAGAPADVALALRGIDTAEGPVLVFDDSTGKVRDLDLRGTDADVTARYASAELSAKGRGRPKLGVTAREVTLLPRHWDWLAAQPGGASAALRRLVDEARKADEGRTESRRARDAAYAAMSALAGDLTGFEEASRSLFAGDQAGFEARVSGWPNDIRDYLRRLSEPAFASKEPRF